MSGPAHPSVTYARRGHVGIVTLDRPDRLNAIGHRAARDLDAAWQEFVADAEAWVGVLTASGPHFCAGRDLKDDMRPLPHGSLDELFVPRTDRPLVAGVRGHVLGMGWYMAAGCDLVVAGADARFAMPQLKVGLPGPYAFAPRLNLTPQLSYELLCLGRPLDAARAHQLGLVNEVVDPDRVTERALAVAAELLAHPPALTRLTKRLLQAATPPLTEGLRSLYDDGRTALETHPDTAEARAALRERRAPRYTG